LLWCVRCAALTVVWVCSCVLGMLPSYLHSMLTWSTYSPTLHMHNVPSEVLTSIYVTCTFHSTLQKHSIICIPQHLLPFVHFMELTVVCTLQRT
jgi:hypothetical protein